MLQSVIDEEATTNLLLFAEGEGLEMSVDMCKYWNKSLHLYKERI